MVMMRCVDDVDDTRGASQEAGLEFEEFFHREHRRLGQALFLLTGNRGEAEDLAQEALTRAFERWDRIRATESPTGYVYRIAVNAYRKRLRRLRRPSQIWTGADSSPDPAEVAGSRADIHRALRELSIEQREALILVEWLGYDAEEAGRLLGIEPVSVRGRLHRAREKLRRELGGTDE
jgi:RNA polymerase sigma-70 factor (ECF subfamily)